MTVKYYRIFNFEQTITQKPIPKGVGRTATHELNYNADAFQMGMQDAASGGMKEGLPRVFLKMDEDHAFCVATYHNSPEYIAGFMGHVLGKKVTPVWFGSNSNVDSVMVGGYRIDGQTQPLLIAYMLKKDKDLGAAVQTLQASKGKNTHIEELRIWANNKKLVDDGTFYDFFDASEQDLEKARALADTGINCCAHHVLGDEARFQVDNQVAFEAAMCRAGVPHAKASPKEASARVLGFMFERPQLVLASSVVGLFVAAAVLLAFALAASPIGNMALLIAGGSGFFAGGAAYAYAPSSCFNTAAPAHV